MGKINVFAFLGLLIIGGLGWQLGQRPPHTGPEQADSRFTTANLTQGKSRIDTSMLKGWMLRGETPYLLIDTRPAASYAKRHLFRAINRDFESLFSLQTLRRLPRHKAIVIYGVNERENANAVEILRLAGLTAFYLPGGHASWASLPVNESVDSDPQANTRVATAKPRQHDKQPVSPPAKHGYHPQQPAKMAKTDQPQLRVGMLSD